MSATIKGVPPAPVPHDFSQAFWDAAKEGTLLLQYCPDSKRYQFFPRPVSLYTGKRNLRWRKASGRGTVYSYTVTRVAPPGFEGRVPYIVATIELAEGVRMLTNVINCAPDDVAIGMKVRVAWEPRGDFTLPVFEPAGRRGAG